MRKEKFVYNTQTLRYEKVVEPLKVKMFRVLGFVSGVIVSAIIIISFAYTHFTFSKRRSFDARNHSNEIAVYGYQ